MLSLRTLYIFLFLTGYFFTIYWWFFKPNAKIDEVIDTPIEKEKAIDDFFIDNITLGQLNVEYKNHRFIRNSDNGISQKFDEVVKRGGIGLPTLYFYFKNTNEPSTQKELLKMICELNTPDMRLELEDILRTSNNQNRLFIINNLASLGYKESVPLLRKMILNKNPRNSEYIPMAQALMALGDKETARLAFEEYLKTNDFNFRLDAIEAISRLGFKESIPILKNQLVKKKPEENDYIPVVRALMALGDKETARLSFEDYLKMGRSKFRLDVIEAISEFGFKESISILKNQLVNKKSEDIDYFPMKKALFLLGDESVVGDLITLGLYSNIHQAEIKEILFAFQPIRDIFNSYGNVDYIGFVDDDSFFKVVDEWYIENVLKKPSPYRSTKDIKFSEPFASEKLAAWNLLKAECEKNTDKYSAFRLTTEDSKITEADSKREIIIIDGSGHGFNLNIYVCHPELDGVNIYHFKYCAERKYSLFNLPEFTTSIRTIKVDKKSYSLLVAGLRVIYDSKLNSWWSGQMFGPKTFSDFVISFSGFGKEEAESLAFCGYAASKSKVDYLKLIVAKELFFKFCKKNDLNKLPDVLPVRKDVFSKVFLQTFNLRADQSNWCWVRERMIDMARDFGDKTLVEPLMKFLEQKYVSGSGGDGRTACEAVNALAFISEKDFRFDKNGVLRDISSIAKDYLEWYKNKK